MPLASGTGVVLPCTCRQINLHIVACRLLCVTVFAARIANIYQTLMREVNILWFVIVEEVKDFRGVRAR